MTGEWYLARVGEVCGSCCERVVALTPMRRLRINGSRCPACAKRLLDEDVPEPLQRHVPPPAPTFTPAAPPITNAEIARARRASPDAVTPKARNR